MSTRYVFFCIWQQRLLVLHYGHLFYWVEFCFMSVLLSWPIHEPHRPNLRGCVHSVLYGHLCQQHWSILLCGVWTWAAEQSHIHCLHNSHLGNPMSIWRLCTQRWWVCVLCGWDVCLLLWRQWLSAMPSQHGQCSGGVSLCFMWNRMQDGFRCCLSTVHIQLYCMQRGYLQ